MKNVADLYRLSPMQQGMLFHRLLHPESAQYFEQFSARLRGPLEESTLRGALEWVVARHAVLRTAFLWDGLDEPLQVVRTQVTVPFSCIDWSDVSEAELPARQAAFLEEDRRHGFDLARAPLLRAALVRLGGGNWWFAWSVSHLILDGWSGAHVLAELFTAEAALRRGNVPDLPAPRPYRDYIAWLEGRDLSAAEAFWRRMLAGFRRPSRVAELETAGPERPRQLLLELSAAETQAMQSLAARLRVTPGTLVQGTFALALARHTGLPDVVFGSVVSGRTPELDGVESMVGLLINTLPLRVPATPEVSLGAWLGSLQEQQLAAREFEGTALVAIQGWSELAASTPLFDCVLGFENYPRSGSLEFPGTDVEVIQAAFFEQANDALSVVVQPGAQLCLEWNHDPARLGGAAAHSLVEDFHSFLSAAVHGAATPGEILRTLAPPRIRELEHARGRPSPASTQGSLGERLDRIGARFAGSPAFEDEDGVWSHAELAARVRAVAAALQQAGVRPGDCVAIGLADARSQVLAFLAVLQAGAAYAPLDVTDPPARLGAVLDSCRAHWLVTAASSRDRFPGTSIPLLAWEELEAADSPPPGFRPVVPGDAALACVMHTSGSTGAPKAVAVPRRAILRLVCDADYLQILPTDRVAYASNPAFDAATFEIFGALLNGGCLVSVPREALLGGVSWKEVVQARRLGVLFVTTALFHTIARLEPDAFAALRCLLFGGEAVDPGAVRAVLRHGPPQRLLHVYGPTENTTFSTWYAVETVDPEATTVPIGGALAGSEAVVLDEGLQPVAAGVAGELYLGGEGLALGYLHAPAATAERFVPHPFAQQSGARLYRTGDRVRRRPDGALEFLGRRDHQVKLRGFRIELGEVETVLRGHPGVADAVATVLQDSAGERRLLAYVAGVPGAVPTPESLRDFLGQRVPAFMVPAAIEVLAALPVGPRGKIDRAALPVPRETPRGPIPEPLDPIEEVLAGMWREVLGIDGVGRDDHFFQRGGHSLLAVRLLSRLRSTLKVELPLRALFEHPTLGALAAAVAAARGGPRTRAPALRPAEPTTDPPLSFAQQRLWFLDQWEPGSAFYTIAGCLRLRGALTAAALRGALLGILQRHEVLRTVYPTRAGRPAARILADAPLDFRRSTLEHADPLEREELLAGAARAFAREPFDLAQGPLLRALLCTLGPGEHALVLALHHIVADGGSLAVLFAEIAAGYEAGCRGSAPSLPALPVQYSDYAVWQREAVTRPEFHASVAAWRQRLAGPLPLLELPTDRPRPAEHGVTGATLDFALDPAWVAELRAFSQRESVTLSMTLLAAFQGLLHRYTGQEDLLVGMPVAGEDAVELEPLVGLFVNTVVLRTRIHGSLTFRDLLARVRDGVLEAHEHRQVPFEMLLEELGTERRLSHTPLFQVMFAYHAARALPRRWGDLEVARQDVDTGTANFDWTLSFEDDGSQVCGAVEYSTDLFDAGTVERAVQHWRNLLEGGLRNPDQPLATLPLLSPAEQESLLARSCGARPGGSRDGGDVVARIVEQARCRPLAAALRCAGTDVSFAELHRRAAHLAAGLQERGVQAEVPVGLCLERSGELVVALLGVLLAGACFVPVDPALPPRRVAALLRDARARACLTAGNFRETPGGASLAAAWEEAGIDSWTLEALSRTPPHAPAPVAPESAAYVLFTSGSTGSPKGVVISRGALSGHAAACRERFALAPGDRVLQFASISFDAAMEEIFPTLSAGATVVLAPGRWLDAEALHDVVEREALTVLDLPTAYWDAWIRTLEERGAQVPSPLRLVIIGGEKPAASSHEVWARVGTPEVLLLNTYGPTEGTVTSTWSPWRPDARSAAWPLGEPIPGAEALVLDAHQQLVPVGVPGDLYLGGAHLARGYAGMPAETATAFVPHPWSPRPGARLYRTGDRARLAPDGLLEFLGRDDDQVKLRGFRIELGEIEHALSLCPEVRQAVVLLRPAPSGREVLVAYVVPAAALRDPAPLRTALAEVLPDYMVPHHFVFLDRLPWTHTGKVDRRGLPDPGSSAAPVQPACAPQSAAENTLARLWAEALGLERVGRDENFFQLGGDSILSIQILSRAREEGLVFTPRQLFQHPTVAQLAAVVERSPASLAEAAVLPEEWTPTPIQQWFFAQGLASPHHWNQAVLLESQAPLEPERVRAVLEILQSRHPALRQRFPEVHGARRVRCAPAETPVPCPVERLPAGGGPGAREAACRRNQAALDLERGPLYRVLLLAEGDAPPRWLHWVVHHLAVDTVTWHLLLGEFQRLYRQPAGVVLPPVASSLADWSLYCERQRSSAERVADRRFFAEQHAQRGAALPRDLAGENRVSTEQVVCVSLEAAETQALLEIASPQGEGELVDALLAALAESLAPWTGSRSLWVELEGHGRDLAPDLDLGRTAGWFTAVFPVFLGLDAAAGWSEMLRAVRGARTAAARHALGYSLLCYAPTPGDGVSLPQPLEISFNYLGTLDPSLDGTRWHPEGGGPERAPEGLRTHVLEVTAFLRQRCLCVDFHFSSALHRESSIQACAVRMLDALRPREPRPAASGERPRPTDFPLAEVTQRQLDRLLGRSARRPQT